MTTRRPPEQLRSCARWLLATALVSAAVTGPGMAATSVTEHMAINCRQPHSERLECDFHVRVGGLPQAVVAEWQDITSTAVIEQHYPAAGDTTALLALVDTSDPARAAAVAASRAVLVELAAQRPPHVLLGLARFDTELELLAPIGAAEQDYDAAFARMLANGRTTELYRNVRDAVRLLIATPATRRVLLILSDGLAEDQAYHHDDVVALAREHGVIISAIGYPRSIAQSVALQTLRRLCDDTAGVYVQADHQHFALPASALSGLLAAADSGGRLSVDLGPFARAGAHGAVDIALAFQTERTNFLVVAPVVLPEAPVVAPAPRAAPPVAASPTVDAPVASVRPPTTATTATPRDNKLVLGLLVTILGASALIYWRLRGNLPGDSKPQAVLAYLLLAEAPHTRYVIDRTPWRIGRTRASDLALSDHSVSRLHAEVRRGGDGALMLKDLDSLNGVFINDQRIDHAQLHEGDLVDIGDVRLKFTLHDADYARQDATVMVRTRMP